MQTACIPEWKCECQCYALENAQRCSNDKMIKWRKVGSQVPTA